MQGAKRGRKTALIFGIAVVAILAASGWICRDELSFFLRFESMGAVPGLGRWYMERSSGRFYFRMPRQSPVGKGALS